MSRHQNKRSEYLLNRVYTNSMEPRCDHDKMDLAGPVTGLLRTFAARMTRVRCIHIMDL